MAVFTFPVPEGLLDLLRDFTVAVVHNEPDDLDRYAAEYFRDLAAAVDHARSASVECSKSRSYLEFDESMYVGFVRSDHGMDEFGTSQGSQRSDNFFSFLISKLFFFSNSNLSYRHLAS